MLEVESINTFYGDAHVLHDVSLHVEEDEIVTLLGRNGVGKTTTLKSIIGLQPPRSGTISLHGERISGLAPENIYNKGVGYISEDRGIFPDLSVRENLVVGLTSDQDEDTAFDSIFEYFPKLEDRLAQQAGTLSGGEQQMLAIGRTLVSDPSLLLVDEPTEGLMPTLVSDLRDILVDLNRDGHTILLVEQNVRLALEISDRAYIMEKGQIQASGDSADLLEDEAVLEEHLPI